MKKSNNSFFVVVIRNARETISDLSVILERVDEIRQFTIYAADPSTSSPRRFIFFAVVTVVAVVVVVHFRGLGCGGRGGGRRGGGRR